MSPAHSAALVPACTTRSCSPTPRPPGDSSAESSAPGAAVARSTKHALFRARASATSAPRGGASSVTVACSAEMHTSVICASDASAFPPPLCVTGPDGRERAVLKQRLRDAPAWLRLVRSWSPRRRPARSARACRREGVALNRRQRRARGASRRCQPRRHRRGRRRWALPAASAALQPRRAQAWTWQTKEASTRSLRARPCFRRAALSRRAQLRAATGSGGAFEKWLSSQDYTRPQIFSPGKLFAPAASRSA